MSLLSAPRALPMCMSVLVAVGSACSDGGDAPHEASNTPAAQNTSEPPHTDEPQPAAAATPDVPFASTIFRATHNSYSGNVDGQKGPILEQLDKGVRFIELDPWDTDYTSVGDYSVGHSGPGDLVDHAGGNPASNKLRDWITPIANWSSQNPSHAPLLVMFDLKSNLTDNTNFAAGNLAALNAEVLEVFGDQLLQRQAVGAALPGINGIRGKVLTLISGDSNSRLQYKRDEGHNPAVAINAHGQVVEVHDSGGGALWYWTGIYGADGRVNWQRHGRYDSGQTPAVALNDDGTIVEVHQSQSATTLWYHVGRLGPDGEIAWSGSHSYDNGVSPTVRFTGPNTVHEIHRSQSHAQNWDWDGAVDAAGGTVAWSNNATTSDALYDVADASSGTSRISVLSGPDGAAPSDTLLYKTPSVAQARIRFTQVIFDEYQAGDAGELQEESLFWAAPATNSSFIVSARQAGHVVRGWDFDSASLATNPLANYPASNVPYSDWYTKLLNDSGAVQ